MNITERQNLADLGMQREGFKLAQALGPSAGKLAEMPADSRLKIISHAHASHLSNLEHIPLLKANMTAPSKPCPVGFRIIQALGQIGHGNLMNTPFTGGLRAYYNAEASETHLHVEIDTSGGLGPMRPFKNPEGEHVSMQHEWNDGLNNSAHQLIDLFLKNFPEKKLSFAVKSEEVNAHQMQEFVDLLNQILKKKTQTASLPEQS